MIVLSKNSSYLLCIYSICKSKMLNNKNTKFLCAWFDLFTYIHILYINQYNIIGKYTLLN